jgi:hypothetical protein
MSTLFGPRPLSRGATSRCRRSVVALLVLSSAVLVRSPDAFSAAHTITTFTVPGSLNTYALSINLSGQITGFCDDASLLRHGFVRDVDGTLTTFDPPGSRETQPVSIASTGQITGNYNDTGSKFHGFVRDVGGAITSFDFPAPDILSTTPMSINGRGQIAGYYNRPDGIHGFLRDADGTMTTFDVPGSSVTFVQSMNGSGQITGYYHDAKAALRAFLRDANGTITTFDAPGAGTRGGLGTIPFSINRSGQIAGISPTRIDTRTAF